MRTLSNIRKLFSLYLFISMATLVIGIFGFATVASADFSFQKKPHYQLSGDFSALSASTLNLNWTMDSNSYLYKNRIYVKVLSPSSLKIKSIKYPKAIQKK